ncbi:hypothetical protein [Pseudovibrio ascidiaceicola]|uniref:hypothetical protein n=1 Tax=Pseudovibrio ascidiaceicola TaxID=285279 RepID=UPI000D692BAC|nr:hypothetical protein [Pseudovibrio ascidiaceicola]
MDIGEVHRLVRSYFTIYCDTEGTIPWGVFTYGHIPLGRVEMIKKILKLARKTTGLSIKEICKVYGYEIEIKHGYLHQNYDADGDSFIYSPNRRSEDAIPVTGLFFEDDLEERLSTS